MKFSRRGDLTSRIHNPDLVVFIRASDRHAAINTAKKRIAADYRYFIAIECGPQDLGAIPTDESSQMIVDMRIGAAKKLTIEQLEQILEDKRNE